jgi:prophage regulatory protein
MWLRFFGIESSAFFFTTIATKKTNSLKAMNKCEAALIKLSRTDSFTTHLTNKDIPMTTNTMTPSKLLRRQEVEALTALSRSTIYEKINSSSPRFDAAFPRPIKTGLASVRWVSSSVEAWIQSRIQAG